jgi:formylglycine-generating enzyme required for sulfatase activity
MGQGFSSAVFAIGLVLTSAVIAEERREPFSTFRDCDMCPEMVVIPPGQFRMGDLHGGGMYWEKPVHDVRIDYSFAVGKYEVMFAEWDACISDEGCGNYRLIDWDWGRGNRPAINVSWDDAKEYVAWLSRKTGQDYRLLSESEWEYAARGGATTQYSWGNSIGSDNANCSGCGSKWDTAKTSPTGSFRPNGFGLFDVHGNVWEWVEECWHDSYNDAPGGECGQRVLRGGSFVSGPRNLRVATRSWDAADYRLVDNGFRIARTLSR